MKRALLINDSRFESLILKDLLSRLEYDVEVADEFDAIYLVEQYEPQLVVVNYIMQQTRGDKMIQLIKAGMPDIVCLLSSSSAIKSSQFDNDIIDGILHTPISMFTLQDVLQRVERKRKINEQAQRNKNLLERRTLRSETDVRFCDHCNQDLSAFSAQIVFCPFCGEELE